MRDLTERALDTATSLGASYADVRIVRRHEESIAIKTGRVEGVASNESEGFGIRVLLDGAWGFASSYVLTGAEADRVAGEAVRIARASATALREPAILDDRPPAYGRYETPVDEDTDPEPLGLVRGDPFDPTGLDRDRFLVPTHDPDVRVSGAQRRGRIECALGQVSHGSVSLPAGRSNDTRASAVSRGP